MTDQKIAAIVETYCRKIPEEFGKLNKLIVQIQSDTWCNDGILTQAHAEAHRMSGAAHCMGFDRIGRLLGRLENNLDVLRAGSIWDTEAAKLQIARAWSAIGYESPNVRAERSALLARPAPPPPSPTRRDPQTQPMDHDDALLRDQNVLVVDDDASVRYLVRNMLLRAGAGEVTLAASGVEALQSLAAAQFTLIISDWNMPVVDGVQLLSRIRQGRTPALRDTPLIFLTSERRRVKFRAAIDLGVDYFIVKPFTQQSVMYAIRSVLRRDDAVATPEAVLRSLQHSLPEAVNNTASAGRNEHQA